MTPSRVKEIIKTAAEASGATFFYGKTIDSAIDIITANTSTGYCFMDSGTSTVIEDNDSFEMRFSLSFLKHDQLSSASSVESNQSTEDSREDIMTDMYDLWKTVKAYLIDNNSDEIVLLKDDGFFIQHGFDITSGYSVRLTIYSTAECL
jgi:hypothetical protein